MTGTTVGHYEILEKLGEGGMGVVYKARDVLLNRMAALKFLPADAADPEKRRRFIQEAQSASALNHPNIVTIYEVAQAGDRDFIAMELVQGQPLDQLLARKALPLERAIACGIQIADALAAAHAAGIVHRDLKPGNVMVTDAGLVKVLDFGLAKLLPGPSSSSGVTETVLAESPRTADGMILGTVAYMSPEQAEGKSVDHRSDIFSFGAVLHEIVTGRRLFQGESMASTLAAILTAEPASLSSGLTNVPPELGRIVSRCLRKHSEKRWQSIADVRIALEELNQDLESGRLARPAAVVSAPRWRWLPIVATAIVVAGLAGFAVWRARPSPPAPVLWRVSRLTVDTGANFFPAISRDGRLVAYISDRAARDSMDLWVQQIDGGDPVQLTKGLGFCRDPSFAADGSRVAVVCGIRSADIYIVPTLGGLPRRLAEGEWPQFSPDGSLIAYTSPSPARSDVTPSIWFAPADGGSGRELKPGIAINGRPVWTPDSKGLLFVGVRDGAGGQPERDWFYVSADDGAVSPTGAISRLTAAGLGLGVDLGVAPDGVLFAEGTRDSTSIYLMPFDTAFRRASGHPLPVITGAGVNFFPGASPDGRRMTFAIGTNTFTNIWRAPIDSSTGQVSGAPVRVTSGVEPNLSPSPSRDGRRLAYLGAFQRAPEVRIRDLASGTDVRLAQANDWSYVLLSPDGSTVVFNADDPNKASIYSVPSTGGAPRRMCAGCGRPVEWSPDRTKLLIDNAGPGRREIHLLDVASGQSDVLLRHAERQLTMPRVSPDGRVISFTMLQPGRARRIYLAPFTGALVPEEQWTVVVEGTDLDRQPAWSPSGNLIYFQSDRDGYRCIWAQRVDTSRRQAVGTAFGVHHLHEIRNNLTNISDPALVGLSIVNGEMFYASFELQANIWLAERRERAAQ